MLKNKWNDLELNRIYLVKLEVGSSHIALVQRYSSPNYGSAVIISYSTFDERPIYAQLKGGAWVETSLLINTDLRFYSTTNGITKIASLPWGIYNLQDSEVRALTDKPSELNQGRAIIITSGLSTNDEKVALILASSGRDGGVYFGYVWGSNTPEFSWKKIIGNNA